jgi:hypothetical protein
MNRSGSTESLKWHPMLLRRLCITTQWGWIGQATATTATTASAQSDQGRIWLKMSGCKVQGLAVGSHRSLHRSKVSLSHHVFSHVFVPLIYDTHTNCSTVDAARMPLLDI